MVQVFDQHAELNGTSCKSEPAYEHYEQSISNNNSQSLSLSSSTLSSTSSSASSPVVNSSTATSSSSSSHLTYACIVTDLTDASNTCKRHFINLSGTYTVEQLIREAAKFYSYDPFTFNLMWKNGHELINLNEINDPLMSLTNIGLYTQPTKNLFEIHEKEGPPKRIKIDDFASETGKEQNEEITYYGSCNSTINDIDNLPVLEPTNYPSLVSTYPARRNAAVNPIEFEPSTTVSSASASYFSYEDESNTGFVGLINQAMTCYLNSLLQTLYMTPEFRNAIYRWKYNETKNDDEDGKKNIPFQLQRLFLNLQTSAKKSIQTHDLTKSFGWNSDDAFQQHDVQELSRVMFDALEKMFKGTEQQNLINELYQGKIKDYVKCLECNTESARVDVFLDVPLCIRPFGSDKTFESVEAALDAFIQPEILDENNKYFCTKCNKMCKAHKGLKFESFPYILSLQLKRFDFDYTTLSRFKLSNPVTFPEILNVNKYLHNENLPLVNDSTSAETTGHTEDSLGESVSNEKKSIKNEDGPIDKIIKLDVDETNKSDETLNGEDELSNYELFSIMIHSGSATGGHYYAYIKCFETDQWYNFNDEKVTKLDKSDISKAFGTSYSSYSSTTAYMLLYRQKNAKRNEKFIKIDEFSEHLKQVLEREKKQQIEANILKEYLDNVCKVKVIVPNLDQDDSSALSSSKRKEKVVNIHKDLTLDKAKLEILKEFSIELNEQKCRILKYDTYNDIIEQSYKNESTVSVFEAVGYSKCPYNLCWYLEILPNEQEFIEYNLNDFKIKVMNLNIATFETTELFNIRLKEEATVDYLRLQIAQKLNCNPDQVRMALEKPHSIYNYVYMSKNLTESLKSQHFSRVSKVFIEYEETADSQVDFEDSKFYYALDAIANMIQMTVYLPSEEQCEMFKRKTERYLKYVEAQRIKTECSSKEPSDVPLLSDQSSNTISSLIADNDSSFNYISPVNEYSKSNMDDDYKRTDTLTIDDNTSSSMSTMSFQYVNSNTNQQSHDDLNKKIPYPRTKLDQTNYDDDLNVIENHFQNNEKKKSKPSDLIGFYNKNTIVGSHSNYNEMETSLDEGIGSSGSLANNQPKSSPTSFENFKSSPIINDYKLDQTHRIGSIMDDEENVNINEDEDQNETHLGDVVDRCEGDLDDLDADANDVNNMTNEAGEDDEDEDDEIDINVDDNDNEMNNVLSEYNRHPYAVSQDDSEEFKKSSDNSQPQQQLPTQSTQTQQSSKQKQRVTFSKEDDLASASPSGEPNDQENSKANMGYLEYSKSNPTESRFIKSNLIENVELGTRILDIRMDKRIELNDFKSHISSYLNIANDNFRVFRICANDIECELTSYENQFSYLTQNTKFLIKLGTPLKYGEYVLPLYKLNKGKGSFSYLCDFMITHNMSVLNHKELLREDLKEECNTDIPIEKMRLRKKILKRPGNILLDHQVFGTDIFVNSTNELCIEHLDEIEKKSAYKLQTSVYLRHWKPDEYELGDLQELILDGNSFETLINQISADSGITKENLEVLKCKRDYPFKSPILDLHRDVGWRDNFYLQNEKLEEGVCFYYRDKTLKLGEISDEKRREMAKEDSLNFRPTYSNSSKKETGIKIQVDN